MSSPARQGTYGSQSYYWIQFGIGSPSFFYVYCWTGVTQVNLIALTNITLNAGDVLTLEVSGTGSTVTLTVLQNGTQVAQGTDTTATRITAAGSVGVRIPISPSPGGDKALIATLWAGAIGGPSASLSPSSASVAWGATQAFTGSGALPNESFTWSAGSGSVSPSSGTSTTYTAPGSGSSDTLTWTSGDLPTHAASASITLMSPASTTFHTPLNNISTTVGSMHTTGSGSLVVATGTGSKFGSTFPLIITASQNGTVLSILEVTGRSTDTLTISGPLEGTSDVNLSVGVTIDMRPTALAIREIQTAVSTLETMAAGLGSAHRNFTAAGTVTLNATTPPVYIDRAGACNGLAAACGTPPSGGPATVTIQTSPDGTTWTNLASVSIASGAYSGTGTVTSALSAGTFLRGQFTAVNGVADLSATLYLMG